MLMSLDKSNETVTGFEKMERVYDLNNLYDAFMLSKKGSSWKSSVQKYESDVLRNILRTKHQLEDGTYKQKPFYEFELNERGKHRHIKSLHISDRVVQRSLCDNVLIPLTQKKLSYDNGASCENKGISFARKLITAHLRKFYEETGSNEGYILQIDFKKFFDSIPHDRLKEMYKTLLTDGTYTLFSALIESFGGDNGVGIGSQISQNCGVYYPTPIDNYFKVVRGCKYYGRYMDDSYIIHRSKEYLRQLLNEYVSLATALGLTVNLKKTQIVKLSHGFTFLKIKYNLLENGYILKRLSRQTITRERRKLKKYQEMWLNGILTLSTIGQAYASWRGTYKKFNSHTTIREMDRLYNSLFGGIYYESEKSRHHGRASTAQERPRGQNGRLSYRGLEDSKVSGVSSCRTRSAV